MRRPLGQPGRRLRVGLVLAVITLLVLGGRLVQLQGVSSAAFADDAATQRLHTVPLIADRGRILDSAGTPLAVSVAADSVFGEPLTLSKVTCPTAATTPCTPAAVAAALTPLLGGTGPLAQAIAENTTKLTWDGHRKFVYLAHGLDPAVAAKINALDLPGIGIGKESKRVHPDGSVAASVLGYTNASDGSGAAGIEQAYQKVLAGKDGLLSQQTDAFGRVIPTGSGTDRQPVAGHDVVLTINADLQWYAQQQLDAAVAATEAPNGTAITMDVQTGQVLAMATGPSFDPDARRVQPKQNYAVSDVYEPGSVNKVITAAAALSAGIVTPATPVTVPPVLPIAHTSHSVHDAENHGTEQLTFAGVLAKSSNIGTVEIAQKVGAQRLYDTMRAFGFGAKTGIGLPGESGGVIPAPADWSDTSIATIPIGQGISVTALQVASVYATIANGGVRVAPSIVAGTKDAAGHFTAAPAAAKRRVISPGVAQQIRTMLEGVVSDEGTAPLAAIPGYRVAGKTGTAERVVDGRYAPHNYTSSFAGFAPADAPKIITVVVLQGTGAKGYFGGQVSAPVFSQVTAFALRAYDVPPTGTTRPKIVLIPGHAAQ